MISIVLNLLEHHNEWSSCIHLFGCYEMREPQLSLVIYSLECHNVMTMVELIKDMMELMECDQTLLVIYSLEH